MRKNLFVKLLAAVFVISFAGIVTGVGSTAASAAPFNVGPKKCKECHADGVKVWEGTEHFKSYKGIHKDKRAKKIVKAVGDKKMKKSATCAICHYTAVQKKPGGKAKISAGTSCESCHGPASDWIDIHNNYGKGVKRVDESAEHKATRLKNRWPPACFGRTICSISRPTAWRVMAWRATR